MQCRSVQLFHMSIERKSKTDHKVVEFVNGYSTLPEAGGMLDQSVWLMEIFDQFRAGENAVAFKQISK